MKRQLFDVIYSSACNGIDCGCAEWIITGNNFGDYWLVCADSKRIGCCNTKPLPYSIEIEKRY